MEEFNREIPYRMEQFKVSFSAHCSAVSICSIPHMLQEEASLVMSEKNMICEYNRVSFVSFYDYFPLAIVFDFPIGPGLSCFLAIQIVPSTGSISLNGS